MRRGRNNLIGVVFLLLVLLISASCGKKRTVGNFRHIPADSIISRRDMVKILADIHVLEAAIGTLERKKGNFRQGNEYYYGLLFSHYHMTEKRFHANLDNWEADPDQFTKLYGDVVAELDRRLRIQKVAKPATPGKK